MAKVENRFYVYQLINPIDNTVFYIGKGTGKRVFEHEKNCKNGSEKNISKAIVIKSIIDAGLSVKTNIIKDNLTEQDAFQLEHKLIIQFKYENLTNIQKGHESDLEKGKKQAKYNLSKMLPFYKWVNIKKRTEDQINLYFECKNKFEEIANYAN